MFNLTKEEEELHDVRGLLKRVCCSLMGRAALHAAAALQSVQRLFELQQ
jgi:hypothetical protein